MIKKIFYLLILVWFFFIVAVPPASAWNNVTHAWITVKAVEYLKNDPVAVKYPLDSYLPYLINGNWYADHSGPICTWGTGVSDFKTDRCDAIHHYGSLDNIDNDDAGFSVDIADPGDYAAPEYAQIVYDQAIKFWPGGATPSLSDLPYLNSGAIFIGASNPASKKTLGRNHVGGFPLCENEYRLEQGGYSQPTITCPRWPEWASTTPDGLQTKESEKNAVTYLGWTTHFIQDMTMPHHVMNVATYAHANLEDKTDGILSSFDHLPVSQGNQYYFSGETYHYSYPDTPRLMMNGTCPDFPVTPEYAKYYPLDEMSAKDLADKGRSISMKNWNIPHYYCDDAFVEAQLDTGIKLTAAVIKKYFEEVSGPEVIEKIPLPSDNAKGSISAEPTLGPAPLTIQFSGFANIPCDSTSWDFGDNSGGAKGSSVSHTYSEKGTYSARFSCTNKMGENAVQGVSETILITVTGPLSRPPIPQVQKSPGFLDMILSIPRQIIGTLTCRSGKTLCNGDCVDVNTDPNNCGICGSTCPSDYPVCAAGTCMPLVSPLARCAGGLTSCNGNCVDVNTDASNCGNCGSICPSDHPICATGTCIAMPSPILRCTGGLTNCYGNCVDVNTDASNCGNCGSVCPSDHPICATGTCIAMPSPILRCTGGLTNCYGNCVDVNTDASNCGNCGSICPSDHPICATGTCIAMPSPILRCTGGLTNCYGNCVDVNTDASNCGNCGSVCPSDHPICATGTCIAMPSPILRCTGGLTNCYGNCVDVNTDASNCGSCGNTCRSDYLCASGRCISPERNPCESGLVYCNGNCVDLMTDANNCGSCGNVCGHGEVCASGNCITMPIPRPRTV